MTLDEFWNIIDKAKNTTDPDEVVEIVTKELANLSDEEIVYYQKHFDTLFERAEKWDLWGAIYLINGGCGDDSFMDFRYSLISMGKEVYNNAIANPDSLADLALNEDEDERFDALFNESFGYIAIEVYEEKTGEEIYDYREDIDREEDMGEEWDFDDRDECLKRLPRLTDKYWEE
ncbi:MAG: DUF4240 domain-containing protein [Campylobacterota bacterium]|nr:DUF4240 domain-containing protein [Campylobacterota bacterium]